MGLIICEDLQDRCINLEIQGDGKAEKLDFFALADYTPDGEATSENHCPNPKAVIRYANFHSLAIDGPTLEKIVGLWHVYVLKTYDEELDAP